MQSDEVERGAPGEDSGHLLRLPKLFKSSIQRMGGGGLSYAIGSFFGLAGRGRFHHKRAIGLTGIDEDGIRQCRGAQLDQEVENNLLEDIKRRQISI